MARQKKPSPDITEPDETVIEGTAEHVDDQGNGADSDTASHKSPPSSGKTRFGRVLIGLCVVLAVLAGTLALGLAWINRLAVEAVNTHITAMVDEGQQQNHQLEQLSDHLQQIETMLNQTRGELAALSDVDTTDKETTRRDNRITALEQQIVNMEAALKALENLPSPALPDNPAITSDDMMIMAQQLAELDQRVRGLEKQLSESAALPPLPAPDAKSEDQALMPDAILIDQIFNRVRSGQAYADLLDQIMPSHPDWVVLQPWADAPPASASALWDDLGQILSEQQSDTPTVSENNDQSWWSWLLSPLNDAISITPITPELNAATLLSSAWEQRDIDRAIDAAAILSDSVAALSGWREAMIDRQALDRVADDLAAALEQ
ncbi:MAG: hypothetical protein ACPF94_07245 [Candidatus Puniceispirillales bacterium]